MMDIAKPLLQRRLLVLVRMLLCLTIVGRIAFGLSQQMFNPISLNGLYGANEIQASYIFWTVFIGSLLIILVIAVQKRVFRFMAATVLISAIGYIILFCILFYTAIPLIRVTQTGFGFEHIRILKTSAESGFYTAILLALPVVSLTGGLCFVYERIVSSKGGNPLLVALGFSGLSLVASFLIYNWMLSAVMVLTLVFAAPFRMLF
jgi:hypothetical protein